MKAVDSRRATWRIIARMEVETTEADEQQAKDAKEYVARVEPDLQKVCDGILALIDESLILSAKHRRVEGVLLRDEGR